MAASFADPGPDWSLATWQTQNTVRAGQVEATLDDRSWLSRWMGAKPPARPPVPLIRTDDLLELLDAVGVMPAFAAHLRDDVLRDRS